MRLIDWLVASWRAYWAKRLRVVGDRHQELMRDLEARVEMYRQRAEVMRLSALRWPRKEHP